MNNFRFSHLARRIAALSGRPAAFLAAAAAIVLWALSGPLFGFSDTWQLMVNTTTTIITFLMVFIIQSTQNRDTTAIQLKLDELIRAQRGARNEMIDLEDAPEEMVELQKEHFKEIVAAAQAKDPDVLDEIEVRSHRHARGA